MQEKTQAYISGPANGEFRQSFLTYRAKNSRRSKMSWFHISLKCNDWLREASYFLRNGFVENMRNICSIFIAITNNYFS